MYLGGNWEFYYADALVKFAGSSKDQRRAAAKTLLSAFESRYSFSDAELTWAHRKARAGMKFILKWDNKKLTAAREAWVEALNNKLAGLEIPAVMSFKLDQHEGLSDWTRPSYTGHPLTLHNGIDLGLALFSSDESVWRRRLKECPFCDPESGRKCGVLFINHSGFAKRGKPSGTCSKEHGKEWHRQQTLSWQEAHRKQRRS